MGEIKQYVKVTGLSRSITIRALFDSGATSSYIRKSVADDIGLKKLGTTWVELGNKSRTIGIVSSVLVKIGDRIAETPIIILPRLSEPMIIGLAFLQEHDINLDFSKDKYKFGKTQPRIRRINRL